ncbi:MAG: translation initiation factor IF-2 [Candidatus Bipolaricaulota bacterium]|nr:translation initiation factor IF-2 [Candidatus Bipolaricaulota bacterium]
MARKRIYSIARELDTTSKELIDRLAELGMPGLKAANTVDEEEYTLVRNLYEEQVQPLEEEEEKGVPRPPVVSVLGHIDHGKTTLLDAIRKSRLVSKEVGGITQRIGAYQADLHGEKITFIDTPGHKAFTGMRARGAQATDIAILVVAADDGVMPQTVEAIDHIRAANIPLIVAINKIDKTNADLNKVMQALAQHGLTPEDWGGDAITVPISALKEENIDDLLEMILLVAEMEGVRAEPEGRLEAIVIESHLSATRGPVATAVIKNGSLRQRDCIVVGPAYGRVKALIDENGDRLPVAGPGKAVEILGLDAVPPLGSKIEAKAKLKVAKNCAQGRRTADRTSRPSREEMSVAELFRQQEEQQKLTLVLKAESTGALEAVRGEIQLLPTDDVELEFLHTGIGAISESDVLLASTVSNKCLVIGFGVKADPKAMKLAEREGVVILTYAVIYELLEEIERALTGTAAPEYQETKIGEAEVRELFKIPAGVVAGCYVTEGKVLRNARVHVIRQDEELFSGEIASLRRFNDDVRTVLNGRECGIRIKGFDDVRAGDRLIIYTLEEVKR